MLTGIVLAAGESSRMGSPKPLLKLGDRTFLEKIVDDLKAAGVDNLLVVLGAKAEEIEERIDLSGVKTVYNPDYRRGQLSSLWAALRELPPQTRGVLFTLADHPAVKLSTYQKLISAWEEHPDKIAVPLYQGRGGHPIIFPAALKEEFLQAPEDQGARAVIYREESRVEKIPVDDAGIKKDIDTRQNYQELIGENHERI